MSSQPSSLSTSTRLALHADLVAGLYERYMTYMSAGTSSMFALLHCSYRSCQCMEQSLIVIWNSLENSESASRKPRKVSQFKQDRGPSENAEIIDR